MNKRNKKKFLNKQGYKSYYKRLEKCKDHIDLFKLIYNNSLSKLLVYKENPILKQKFNNVT